MKKLLLLFCLLSISLAGFSQSWSPSKSTVASGEVFTVNAVGESNVPYFSSFTVLSTGITSIPADPFVSNWITLGTATNIQFYDPPIGSHHTSFQFSITNSHPSTDYTVVILINTNVSSFPGGTTPNVEKTLTVTVQHALIGNELRQQTFYKSCSPGFGSDPYTYSVPAGKYKARTLAEANAQADAEITASGQSTANANLTCKLIYNSDPMSGTFTKNNCPTTYLPGPPVTFSIPAGQIQSFISLADANAKATTYLNTQGQLYANNVSDCIEERMGYLCTRRTTACSATGEVNTAVYLHGVDFTAIPAGTSSTGYYAYAAATGTTKVTSGYYKGLYSDFTDGNYDRIYFIDSDGQITGYTLCEKPAPPASTDVITVSYGTGFSSPGDPPVHVIHLVAETAYTTDVDVSGTVMVYNSSSVLIGSADFTITLPAGLTSKTQNVDITLSGTGTKYKVINLSTSPTMDGTRAILTKGISTL